MWQFEPYLFFDGNCAEALRFYERTFDGKVEALLRYADTPKQEGCPDMPPGADDLIAHGRLVVDGRALMASDAMPGQYKKIEGFSLSVAFAEVERGKRVFDALTEGGHAIAPMTQTFWVESFGMAVDKFGVSWMINAGRSLLPPPQA